jgi:hypothetical protein
MAKATRTGVGHCGGVAVADGAGFVSVSEFGGGFADLGGNLIGVGGDDGGGCADECDGGVAGGVRERNGKGEVAFPPFQAPTLQ